MHRTLWRAGNKGLPAKLKPISNRLFVISCYLSFPAILALVGPRVREAGPSWTRWFVYYLCDRENLAETGSHDTTSIKYLEFNFLEIFLSLLRSWCKKDQMIFKSKFGSGRPPPPHNNLCSAYSTHNRNPHLIVECCCCCFFCCVNLSVAEAHPWKNGCRLRFRSA